MREVYEKGAKYMKRQEKEKMENLAHEMKKYTYEDLLKIDDGNRYELIDGQLYLMSSPTTKHQEVVGTIYV